MNRSSLSACFGTDRHSRLISRDSRVWNWALSPTTEANPAARTDGPFTVSPFTQWCAGILHRRRHIVIGVSLGSGFFSQERLTACCTGRMSGSSRWTW